MNVKKNNDYVTKKRFCPNQPKKPRPSRKYLRLCDITDGEIATISSKPVLNTKDTWTYQLGIWLVPLKLRDGKTIPWLPNKTSMSYLEESYGFIGTSWVGKKVKLSKVRSQLKTYAIVGTPFPEPKVIAKKFRWIANGRNLA